MSEAKEEKRLEDVKMAAQVILEKAKKESVNPESIYRSLNVSPSKRKILNLTKDQLLQYNALIFHKGCTTLSSTQRKMVKARVSYLLNKGSITLEEVYTETNKLNALIHGELKKELYNDDTTKQ